MANPLTPALSPLPRVTIHGRPGTLLQILPCGSLAVRLDGEGTRYDLWHKSQVVAIEVAL